MCPRCRRKIEKAIERERKAFWDSLPERFDVAVDGWASEGATTM